jgi:RecA-family ATPase
MRTLKISSVRDIVEATAPQGELIPGLLPAGGITILTAPPKTGKTLLACQMAIAVREGKSFLGFPAGPASPVLYLDRESRRDELETRFSLLQNDADDSFAIQFCQEVIHLSRVEDVDAVIDAVQSGGYGLLIIDTLNTHMIGVDENDAGSVSVPLDALRRIQQSTGAAILVVAHAPKIESNGKIAAKTRGSNAITAVASMLLLLSTAGRAAGKLAVDSRFSAPVTHTLARRSDGFWAAEEKGVKAKKVA